MPEPLSHDALASSLATHLRAERGPRRRMTWENMTFNCGEEISDAYSCRPDVFSIVPALDPAKTRPWTCEVKVSRSDFFNDVRAGKWQRYRRFSARIWFAAPIGMIKPGELPPGTGLWEYTGRDWAQTVQPKFNKGWELTGRDMMRLILGKWGTFADQLLVREGLAP